MPVDTLAVDRRRPQAGGLGGAPRWSWLCNGAQGVRGLSRPVEPGPSRLALRRVALSGRHLKLHFPWPAERTDQKTAVVLTNSWGSSPRTVRQEGMGCLMVVRR